MKLGRPSKLSLRISFDDLRVVSARIIITHSYCSKPGVTRSTAISYPCCPENTLVPKFNLERKKLLASNLRKWGNGLLMLLKAIERPKKKQKHPVTTSGKRNVCPQVTSGRLTSNKPIICTSSRGVENTWLLVISNPAKSPKARARDYVFVDKRISKLLPRFTP